MCNADLSYVDLSYTNLSNTDLSYADLRNANLCNADLSYVDLYNANLGNADLSYVDLYNANLGNADLGNVDLRGANLSNAKGLTNPIDYLNENFERTNEGYIVYKIFGLYYNPPAYWEIESNSIIQEEVNYNRCNNCGCGINIATKEWVIKNNINKLPIWKLLIKWEWLPTVVVPYNTDGKIRCGKAMLLEEIKI